jgi:Na+/proline symporter
MFQVMVVENDDEGHLARASWAFPLYLMAMSLFIVPIAVVGLERMPAGANPDMFVLTLPLAEGQGALAMLAFLGGFSSATSMVIVESIALATMISNHVMIPLWLRLRPGAAAEDDLRSVVLMARRLAIAAVLALGYGYYHVSGGSAALASIGLIAFLGVAQVLPALLGGIFWRGATRTGAILGLVTGLAVWAYTSFLPSFGPGAACPRRCSPTGSGSFLAAPAFAVRHRKAMDPIIHALFWSMALNVLAFCLGSLFTFPGPVERLQGAAFVNVFEGAVGPQRWARGRAEPEALLGMAQRILGEELALPCSRPRRGRRARRASCPTRHPAFWMRWRRGCRARSGRRRRMR